MPKPDLCTDILNRFSAQFWPAMVSRQNSYFAANGRYWQGRRTHTVIPADGAAVVPDRASSRPSDSIGSWSDRLTMPAMRCAVQCDVHDGPAGKSYSMRLSVRVAGQLWAARVRPGVGDAMVVTRDWIEAKLVNGASE